jgi:predicted N-acetyltransferase YhbS
LIVVRQVTLADLAACHAVEVACFPPAEAASLENIRRRIELFPEGFLVAEQAGELIGIVNSGATNADDISDEEFKKLIGHDSAGANIVIFSLAVLPVYQRQGIAAQLMWAFIERSRQLGKHKILLICKPPLIAYYARFGFVDAGPSSSTHGGSLWHEMMLDLSANEYHER